MPDDAEAAALGRMSKNPARFEAKCMQAWASAAVDVGKFEAMVEEAIVSLGLPIKAFEDGNMTKFWRVTAAEIDEFATFQVVLETTLFGEVFLKLRAGSSLYDWTPARAMLFANKWNMEKRFTKVYLDDKDEDLLVLEMDMDLQLILLAERNDLVLQTLIWDFQSSMCDFILRD